MPPLDNLPTPDHDLLVKLNENMLSLRDEMRSITATFNNQYADHEARLRVVEASNERLDGASKATRWLLAAIAATATIIEPLVLWLLGGNIHR